MMAKGVFAQQARQVIYCHAADAYTERAAVKTSRTSSMNVALTSIGAVPPTAAPLS
ncbi:hypothetical protein SAMN05216264_10562 [Pseudomonas marincola]|nr:hypothetical protein SAMN05216264_10562 [Pseudomonas marincola]